MCFSCSDRDGADGGRVGEEEPWRSAAAFLLCGCAPSWMFGVQSDFLTFIQHLLRAEPWAGTFLLSHESLHLPAPSPCTRMPALVPGCCYSFSVGVCPPCPSSSPVSPSTPLSGFLVSQHIKLKKVVVFARFQTVLTAFPLSWAAPVVGDDDNRNGCFPVQVCGNTMGASLPRLIW